MTPGRVGLRGDVTRGAAQPGPTTRSEALKQVSSGFRLVYISLLLFALAVVIAIVGYIIVRQMAQGGNLQGAIDLLQLVAIAVVCLQFGSSLFGLVGRIRCMAIPDEAAGAKQLIVISTALATINLLLNLLLLANDVGGDFFSDEVRLVLGIGQIVFWVASIILFLLFTRNTAEFVRRRDLSANSMSVLWLFVGALLFYGVAMGIQLAGGGGRRVRADEGACAAGILVLVSLVIGLIALIQGARLLTGMTEATLSYASRVGEEYEDDRPERRPDDEGEQPWDRR